MMTVRNFTDLPEARVQNFDWLFHPALVTITDALCVDNPQGAMYVGGCVRDSLRGNPPALSKKGEATDIDIATILDPDAAIAVLKRAGVKTIPTGYDHGTITAVLDNAVVEITSLRADVETDGRHAVVQYTDDWDQDWRRRDFTINAIYLTPDGRLFNPAGGLADLAQNRLVFIGDPETRIKEDYLRILRFYRFSARFAEQMDKVGSLACKFSRAGLKRVSSERIGQELLKILAGPQLPFVLNALDEDEILDEIFSDPADVKLATTLSILSEARTAPELVLAALWPEVIGLDLDHALRLSNHQGTRRRTAISAATRFMPLPEEEILKELLYRSGEEAYTDGALLAWARVRKDGSLSKKEEQSWQETLALPLRWMPPVFPISGKDFVARGMEEGQELGEAIAKAEEKWIRTDYPTDEAVIEEIIIACLPPN